MAAVRRSRPTRWSPACTGGDRRTDAGAVLGRPVAGLVAAATALREPRAVRRGPRARRRDGAVLEDGRLAAAGSRGCCTGSASSPWSCWRRAAAAYLAPPSAGRDEAQVAASARRRRVVGAALATTVLAAFLYLAARLADLHLNELFSAQSDEHHKSFLRMHILDDGAPRRAPAGGRPGRDPLGRRRRRRPTATHGSCRPHPIGVRLIEPPVVIPREVPRMTATTTTNRAGQRPARTTAPRWCR